MVVSMNKDIKKYLAAAAASAVILPVGLAVLRALASPGKSSHFVPVKDADREKEYAEKLSRMVACETVSVKGESQREKFLIFHKLLEELFPLVHKELEKTEIDGNLLFRWKGAASDKPIVLMGHQDVVAAEGEWEHEAFGGEISEGRVWGRGSADTKCSVMAFFQAVEELLEEGAVPAQDVYLASSCTEETGGDGAPKLVAELKRRGVAPWLVCDEGGAIVTDPIAGVKGKHAMIGVLEKGHGNLLITARSSGGHSSYPPKNSPIARLAAFVCDIEKNDPMRIEMGPELKKMFETLSDYGPFYMKLLMGNLWLFGPLVKKLLPAISPQAAALFRTTIAFTQQSGSEGANVMPQAATLTVNMRFIPHQGMDESISVIRNIASKYDLEVSVLDGEDYCAPVDTDGEAYRNFVSVIKKVFPGLPICPYVMTGGTDARYLQEICDACIRFSPVVYGPEQMKGMHGLNECIETSSLPGAVDFYKALVKSLQEV